MKTSELEGQDLDLVVHGLLYPNDPIKKGCTAPPYSYDWAFGGPIIERECIELTKGYGIWSSQIRSAYVDEWIEAEGATPLIAAMRCYVASKLGDEVEIPEELTKGEMK